MAQLSEELTAQLRRLVTSEGLELVAVEVTGGSRRPVVRLVLDRAGGVTLADCEQVARQASVMLDTHDPFPGAYSLEVTSPGLDRKFYSKNDFVRFAGEMVKVRMRPTWRGARTLTGILRGISGDVVRLADATETEHMLPVQEIFEARLAPFAQPPGPAPKGKRKQR